MADLPIVGDVVFVSEASDKIKLKGFPLKLARTLEEMQKGMMFANEMKYALGFPYPDSRRRRFWMKQVQFDLDIVFCSNGVVTEIIHHAASCKTDPCPTMTSRDPADLAIELPGGTARLNSIREGDQVVILI